MTKKKILFFGTPEIAVPSLETLEKLENVEIVGVGVFPDKPVGRKQIMTPCPVKVFAQKLQLPIFKIANKEDLEKVCETENFDLGIVIAFGMIFPASILKKPFLNVHFSLLPKYRGASPVQSAILNGDKISGITFQRMVTELDAGDILLQEELPIARQKTSEVFEKFSKKTAETFPKFLEEYFSNSLKPSPQDESQVTLCKKFTKADGEIFPESETAEEIFQKYLAFDLFPGIFLKTKKGNIKLTSISFSESENSHPLGCKDGNTIFIQRAQIPGKTEMPISEILKGNPDLFN